MQDRLDIFYDRISELEEAIVAVNMKMNTASGDQITADTFCKILLDFDIMYDRMSDTDKKQFFQSFIKSVEIEENPKAEGRLLKHIDFMFPLNYKMENGQFLLFTENDVETVCLLSKLHEAKHHVNVRLDMDEMDLTAAERR